MNEELAKVESVFVGEDRDHGILTIMLMLKGEGNAWGQGYGQFSYLGSDTWTLKSQQDGAMAFAKTIRGLCRAFSVDNVFDIKGKQCWVRRTSESRSANITSIKPVTFTGPQPWFSMLAIIGDDYEETRET